MSLNTRNRTLLAKIETVYGTDATPVGATDGVLLSSLDLSPLELETVENTVIRPYLGAYTQLIAGRTAKVSIEVALAGFGTAGPAAPTPGLDALLRCCGLARTITAGTSVAYTPISTGFESATLYVYLDGTLHRIFGARGTATFTLQGKQQPKYKFEITGLYGGVSDAALIQPALGAYQTALPVQYGNTTLASFLGSASGVALNALEIALGNTVTYRNLVGNREEVLITDRQTTGSFEIEALLVSAKDIWAAVNSLSLTAINVTHGTVVGNRVTLATTVAQATNPKFGDQDSIVSVSGDLRLVPSAANNEFSLTLT